VSRIGGWGCDMKQHLVSLLTILSMSLLPAVRSSAQEPDQGPPPQDQQSVAQQQGGQPQDPQTRVGRISVINGDVSTQRGDSGDWVADTINTPVAPGDTLSTAPRSRTEVQLDHANVLRLDHDTQAKVSDLSRSRIQVQVANGLADYAILKDGGPGTEIDTPNVAIHPLGRGIYRIQVSSPTESYVTVREGEAQVSTPQGSTNVTKGQTIAVQGSDNPQYKVDEAQARDEWDHWNVDRDKTILSAQSWRHTDPYYTGSEDLDAYGQWHNVPGYGDVWQPTQPPGWAPYSVGSWVWEPDWGYTWVSAEPWGWAPYHYGRWFLYNNAWAWWPGPIGFGFGGWYRPIWAPAYVNFFGFGGLGFGFGFGVGFGFGSIGWLPVGPCDPFFPWWGRFGWGGRWGSGWGRGWGGWNHGGFNTINVRNITNINNFRNMNGAVPPLAGANRPQFSNLQSAFSNPRIRGAISTVASNKFGQGRVPVSHGVTPAMLRDSSVVAGRMPVVPTRASLSASSRGAAASSIPRAGSTPTHFAGTQSVAANRGSFAQQQEGIRQMLRGQTPASGGQQGRSNVEAAESGRQTASGGSQFFGGRNDANGARSFGGQTAPGSARQGQFAEGASRSFGSAGTNDAGRMASQAARSNPASQSGVHGWQSFAGQGGRTAAPNSSLAANRQQSSGFGTSSVTAPQADGNRAQSGWQQFASQGRASAGAPSSSFAANRTESRGFSTPRQTAPERSGNSTRSGWQGFSSQPAPRSTSASSGRSESGYSSRSGPGGYASSSRSSGSGGQLPQMNRPMSSPRSAPSYGGGYGGFGSGGHNALHPYGGYTGSSSSGSFGGRHSGGSGGGGGHFGGSGGDHSGGARHAGGSGHH